MKKVWELPPGTGVLGVGSSAGAPLRLSPSTSLGASAKQGRLSRKAREGAHPPVIPVQTNLKTNPWYTSPVKVAARPSACKNSVSALSTVCNLHSTSCRHLCLVDK